MTSLEVLLELEAFTMGRGEQEGDMVLAPSSKCRHHFSYRNPWPRRPSSSKHLPILHYGPFTLAQSDNRLSDDTALWLGAQVPWLRSICHGIGLSSYGIHNVPRTVQRRC
ncbi:hypothetical protein BDZ89DRAFT_1087535 [Hymenopellis radicata]|nr:hypothetical protein BDZ89DRAFT_1087535 [Hymenopellis radicata]